MTTSCPNCGALVELSDSAPGSGVCPDCRAVVRWSAESAAADWQPTSSVLKVQFGILLVLLLGAAAEIGPFQVRLENSPAVCVAPVLLMVYFLCICICASAPDRTARRCAVSCLLTLVFGSVGLFGGTFGALNLRAAGLPSFLIEWGIGLGAFAVYYSAFVFLMRFHATVALAFGNRTLGRECHIFLLAPIVVVLGNVWVERIRVDRLDFRIPGPLELGRTFCNFAVVALFAIIVLRTFRTIDRGPGARAIDVEIEDGEA